MRSVTFCMLFTLSMAAWGSSAQGKGLKHDWREVRGENQIQYVSNYPAPAPFSESGEPEATLTMQAGKVDQDMTLPEILKTEIADIREGLAIADYQEEDGRKPVDGIVSYIEEIDGQQVAFIKYRVAGTRKAMLAHPRSVIHAILVKKGTVFYIHLMVLYAGHQDEVRSDQIRLVKAIIKH